MTETVAAAATATSQVREHQEQQPISELHFMSASSPFPSCQAPLTFLISFHSCSFPSSYCYNLIALASPSYSPRPTPNQTRRRPISSHPCCLAATLLLFLLFFPLLYNCKMKTFFRVQEWVICASEAFNAVGSSDVSKLLYNKAITLGLINNLEEKRDFLLKMLTRRDDLIPLQTDNCFSSPEREERQQVLLLSQLPKASKLKAKSSRSPC